MSVVIRIQLSSRRRLLRGPQRPHSPKRHLLRCYVATYAYKKLDVTFVYTHLAPISSTLGYKPWYHGETNDWLHVNMLAWLRGFLLCNIYKPCSMYAKPGVYHLLPFFQQHEIWWVQSAVLVSCTWSVVCTICYPFSNSMRFGEYSLLSLCHVHEVWCVPSATLFPTAWDLVSTVCCPCVTYMKSGVYYLPQFCHGVRIKLSVPYCFLPYVLNLIQR